MRDGLVGMAWCTKWGCEGCPGVIICTCANGVQCMVSATKQLSALFVQM